MLTRHSLPEGRSLAYPLFDKTPHRVDIGVISREATDHLAYVLPWMKTPASASERSGIHSRLEGAAHGKLFIDLFPEIGLDERPWWGIGGRYGPQEEFLE
jgi:hypothetical protein